MAFNKQKLDGGGLIGSNVYVLGDDFYIIRGANKQTDSNNNPTASACFVRDATTVLNQPSAAKTVSGNSADLVVGPFSELAVDVNITVVTGTSPTVQFFVDRKGVDGVYYPIWQSSSLTAIGQVSTSIGAGCSTSQAFGSVVRLRWVIGGTSPSWTFSVSIQGK